MSPGEPRSISLRRARQVAVTAQLLSSPRPRSILEVVEGLGSVQMDPTRRVARTEHLTFISTPHRVINQSASMDRYSIAFFFDPSLDATVECLARFSSTARPVRYAPIRYGDYYALRLDKNFQDRIGAAPG